MQHRLTSVWTAALLALALPSASCGGGKGDQKSPDVKTAEDDGAAKADDGAEPADDGPDGPADEAAPEPSPDSADETAGDETGAATDDGAAPGETSAAELPPEEQIKALLTEVTNKKTKDDRATAALEEAKTLGADVRDLAKAANKRGERLSTSPDRATVFFEWAQAVDEKYPDATFNLAKIAANTGDIEKVKELLTEVKKRRGKKLLQTVEFDPTFALVADDPDVQALLK